MIGREKEVKELNKLYDRNRAELVAIYVNFQKSGTKKDAERRSGTTP